MHILAIETTGAHCSVALFDGSDLPEYEAGDEQSHLKDLLSMTDELLSDNGISMNDIDHIAVSTGPGSFTGIRIGVTTARALSQATGIPLIAVPSLYAFVQLHYEFMAEGGIVCPLINARRGQVYAAAYELSDVRGDDMTDGGMQSPEIVPVIEAGPYMLDGFIESLGQAIMGTDAEEHSQKGNVLFIGDGVDAYHKEIEKLCAGMDHSCQKSYQSAAGVAIAGTYMLTRPDEFAGRIGLTYEELEPEYMRKTEAEQRLAEGTLGRGLAGKGNK